MGEPTELSRTLWRGDVYIPVDDTTRPCAVVDHGSEMGCFVWREEHNHWFVSCPEDERHILVAAFRWALAGWDTDDRAHAHTMAQRDEALERIGDIAVRLGCEEEWSNVHSHAHCIEEAIVALEKRAERTCAKRVARALVPAVRAMRDVAAYGSYVGRGPQAERAAGRFNRVCYAVDDGLLDIEQRLVDAAR